MKRSVSIVLALTLTLGLILTNAGLASAGGYDDCQWEGLTPGYWKNHTDAWGFYDPSLTLEQLFNVPDVLGLDNYTLLEALNFGGGPGALGGAKILLRAAVAAYLNSSDPDIAYYLGAGTVLAQTNAALSSLDRATMLALAAEFDANNNLGTD